MLGSLRVPYLCIAWSPRCSFVPVETTRAIRCMVMPSSISGSAFFITFLVMFLAFSVIMPDISNSRSITALLFWWSFECCQCVGELLANALWQAQPIAWWTGQQKSSYILSCLSELRSLQSRVVGASRIAKQNIDLNLINFLEESKSILPYRS